MQKWNAALYAPNARFVADYGEQVVELLKIQNGEHVLDLGCGDGALTLKLIEKGADVVGVDASQSMVRAAKKLGLDARRISADKLEFNAEFDAVFSNAALHWIKDSDAVLNGVARALKKNGRFAGEMGGFGNCAAIATALIAVLKNYNIDGAARFPWYFPTREEYSDKLKKHGFEIKYIEIIPRQTPLETGMKNWLKVFANPFLEGLDEKIKEEALDKVVAVLQPSLYANGKWIADYVRLRFFATIA